MGPVNAAGRYIALEGGEGCGKSTQAERLACALDAVLTREPGGTSIGARLREVLLDPANDGLDPRAEALLMAADRAQHRAQVLAPALRAGRHVVSDRSVYSSLAYQGGGRGLALEELRDLSRFALDGHWPDVVVLLDLDVDVASERIADRPLDRFEREGDAFARRLRQTFLELADAEPDRWVVVDAGAPVETVARQILGAVRERIGVA